MLFNFEGTCEKENTVGIEGRKPTVGSDKRTTENGGVAQLGEHLPCKQGVMGSNPIISTKTVRVPQSVRSRINTGS